jgi:hypothetical protein
VCVRVRVCVFPSAAGQCSPSPLVRAGLKQNQAGYDGRMHRSVYSFRASKAFWPGCEKNNIFCCSCGGNLSKLNFQIMSGHAQEYI